MVATPDNFGSIGNPPTTTVLFFGLTMSCAQCHDHKYESWTQDDYYRFFAFFTGKSGSGTAWNRWRTPHAFS